MCKKVFFYSGYVITYLSMISVLMDMHFLHCTFFYSDFSNISGSDSSTYWLSSVNNFKEAS